MKPVTIGILAALAAPAAPAQTPAAGTDPASIRQGELLVAEVAKAYEDAPAFTDSVQVTYRGTTGAHTETMAVALGPGGDARIQMEGYIVTAKDGRFYLERRALPGKYFAGSLDGDLLKTFRGLAGGAAPPIPQCILRYGEDTDAVEAFGVSRARNLRLTGYEARDGAKGTVFELRFGADAGVKVTVTVDPKTRFILGIRVDDGFGVHELVMSPKRHESLPEPIAFDPGGRREVASLSELRLTAGDPAPDFTLESLAGEPVTLSDHRGAVVVLDFWATWCGPCRWALPKLQELARWAEESGHPVRVFAVNIGERQPTPEKIRQVVSEFWKSQGLTMPTLLDFDGTVAEAYDVGSIPYTVLIGPDGRVIRTLMGLDPNANEALKQEALQALRLPQDIAKERR